MNNYVGMYRYMINAVFLIKIHSIYRRILYSYYNLYYYEDIK